MLDLKKYLEQTGTVLITKEAYSELCLSASKWNELQTIKTQEPCSDAISRQAVLDYIDEMPSDLTADGRRMIRRRTLEEYISDTLPSVSPQPKTGHWIEIAKYSDGKHKIECSECGNHIFDRGHANSFNVKNKYKYCPNCGCRMVEPQESEDEG